MKWNTHSKYGCIRIGATRVDGVRNGLSIKSPFCEGVDRVCITINEDSIKFSLVPIDYSGKTYILTPDKSGWYRIGYCSSIDIGGYPIDEEDSTVDEWVCYFEDVVE
jgi:hypothetical protein